MTRKPAKIIIFVEEDKMNVSGISVVLD